MIFFLFLNNMNIYILRLQEKKYYIGTAPVPVNRALDYFKRYPNAWIKKYPIVKMVNIYKIPNTFTNKKEKAIHIYYEIEKLTAILMSRFSIENVRSDTTPEDLSPEEENQLQTFLEECKKICYKCNSRDHTAEDCFYVTEYPTSKEDPATQYNLEPDLFS